MGNYAGLTLAGLDSFDRLGHSVSAIGDFNGDGFGDFVVGAPGAEARFDYTGRDGGAYSAYGRGAAYVIFGDGDGLPPDLSPADLDGSNGFRIIAGTAQSSAGDFSTFQARWYDLGSFVAGIGDVNGDGFADVAVATQSTWRYSNFFYDPETGTGETVYFRENFIYVIFGTGDSIWEATEDGATLRLDQLEQQVGDATFIRGVKVEGVDGILTGITGIGDLDGDGIDDFAIMQRPDVYSYGGYYPSLSLEGVEALSGLSGTGGATGEDTGIGGFVILGDMGLENGVDVNDLDGSNGFAVETGSSGLAFGSEGYDVSASGARIVELGDVDGDGFDDIAITVTLGRRYETYYDPTPDEPGNYDGYYINSSQFIQRSFVLYGRDMDPVDGVPFNDLIRTGFEGVHFTDPNPYDGVDFLVPVFGPTDYDLIEVTWPGQNGSFASGGPSYGDGFLQGVIAGIGDVNGDGFDDVAVSFPNLFGASSGDVSFEPRNGAVYVLFGGEGGLNTGVFASPNGGADAIFFDASDTGVYDFGQDIAAAGDVNGDGFADFLISAGRNFSYAFDDEEGEVYLVFGGPTLDLLNDFSDPAKLHDGGPVAAGSAMIFQGARLDDFIQDQRQTMGGDKDVDALGLPAFDVDGDGFADFLIGAPRDRGAGSYDGYSTGRAFLVRGGMDSLEALDAADGYQDGVVDLRNLGLDVDTGVLPIQLNVRQAGSFFFTQSRAEGDAGETTVFTFEVVRNGDLSAEVTFDYALGLDFFSAPNADDFVGGVLPSGTVTFVAGESVATVEIEVQGDTAIESNESFTFQISNPTTDNGAPISIGVSEVEARILNDDQPVRLSVGATNGLEDTGVVTFTIFRFGDTQSEVEVTWSIAGGFSPAATSDDVVGGLPQTGTTTFLAGDTFKTITVTPVADDVQESNETLRLTITGAASAEAQQILGIGNFGTGYILNDDFPPTIAIRSSATVTEGNSGITPFSFIIDRLGANDEVTVSYEIVSDGGLTSANSADVDVPLPTTGSVTFMPGDSLMMVPVNIIGDRVIEPHEFLTIRITGVQSADGTAYTVSASQQTLRIFNDDGFPPVIPPGLFGWNFGDPHLVTLDGLGYDFMAAGEFVLIESKPGEADPFQVQVRYEPFPGSDLVSIATRMAVEIDGVRVELRLGDAPLLVDGVETAIDPDIGGIDVTGDGTLDVYVNAAGDTYTIVLNSSGEQVRVDLRDTFMDVNVFLAAARAGKVQGLLGDGNGNTANDLTGRDGTLYAQPVSFADLYGAFADSWRLDNPGGGNGKDSLFTYGDGEDTSTFTLADFPAGDFDISDLPADVLAAAEAAADAAGITDPVLREAAILDFALTGEDDFLESAAGSPGTPTTSTQPTDAPALPDVVGVSATAASITEGDTGSQTVSFTFWRSGAATDAVEVHYVLAGTANAADLAVGTALSGTVSFAAGELSKLVAVEVLGDLTTEANETLIARITGIASGTALIGASQGVTTIVTDDFPPTAEDDAFSILASGAVAGNVLAPNGGPADSDPDGDTLTVVSAGGLAPGAVLSLTYGTATVQSNGAIAYTPGAAAIALAAGAIGTDTFSYTVSDGNGGTDTATVSITVTGENDAPTAVDDDYATGFGVALAVDADAGLLANDGDLDGDAISVVSFQVAANGELNVLADGSFTYAPDAGFSGTETILYTISDGFAFATATLEITVEANTPPTAVDDDYATGFGVALAVDADAGLLANDGDLDGDAISVVSFQVAANGELNVLADGSFTYAPDAGFSGTETILYTISDGFAFATATLEITVEAGPTINLVEGTNGRDTLTGTDGADRIVSKAGSGDRMSGLGGDDEFVFRFEDASNGVREQESILDFVAGSDTLVLEGGLEIASFRKTSTGALIEFSGGDRDVVVIRGTGIETVDDLFRMDDPGLIV